MNIPSYTLLILNLLLLNVFLLILYRKRIDWKKFLAVNSFCTPFGTLQLWGLQTLGNVPAWYFLPGTTLNIQVIGKVDIEDIVFIPVCTSLFYFFSFLMKRVPDIMKNNYILHGSFVGIIISLVAYTIMTSGIGTLWLILGFGILPFMMFLHIVSKFRIDLNYTHIYLTFLFVCVFGIGWEIVDKFILFMWKYDPNCNLLSKIGFFYKNLFHTAITIAYSIVGWVVFYSSETIFSFLVDRRRSPKLN